MQSDMLVVNVVKKKKQELVHKLAVKSKYYKELAKNDPIANAPEYVKKVLYSWYKNQKVWLLRRYKIFGERTIDDEGNIVAYKPEEEEKLASAEAETHDNKKKRRIDEDRVYDLDEPSSSSSEEEDDESEEESKGKAKGKKDTKKEKRWD